MNNENMWKLIAHNHWYRIKIFGKEIKFCCRCTGFFFGIYFITIFQNFFVSIIRNFSINHQIIIYASFVLPIAFDWISYSWGLRKSNNNLRFFTGLILGLGTKLTFVSRINLEIKILLYFSILMSIMFFGIIGKINYQKKSLILFNN